MARTVAGAEKALAEAEARHEQARKAAEADPKAKQAEAIRARGDDLHARGERMRSDGWKLQQEARALLNEVEAEHGVPEAAQAIRDARDAVQEAKADKGHADLLAGRKAWLAKGRGVKTDVDFLDFCILGMPGLSEHRYAEESKAVPLGGVSVGPYGKQTTEPAPCKAKMTKSKVGSLTVRTATNGNEDWWVAFDPEGRAVAVCEAKKYGRAFDADGLDLKRKGEDIDAMARASRHSGSAKDRFAYALEAAFPDLAKEVA